MSTPAALHVEAQGHRGARGLRPENTLPSFAYALELGVHALELDVALTADEVVILHHDPTISPVTCRDTAPADPADPLFPYTGRRIGELTLAQLKTLDAGVRTPAEPFAATLLPLPGTPIATLPEVCALLDDYQARDVRLCVELKTDPSWRAGEVERFVAAVLDVLDRYGRTAQSRLLGFDWRVLGAAARLTPGTARVALIETKTRTPDWLDGLALTDVGDDLAAAAAARGATMLSPEKPLLTAELLGSAHAHGLPVVVWTVNDPAEMGRFIELGVDAIVTDYPDRLRTVMTSYGLPLPPACPRPEPVLP